MKKIICLILTIAMMSGMLVSCGYSIAKDDMSKYVKFGDEEFAAFTAFLQNIEIEDGDYTAEDTVRANKNLDNFAKKLSTLAEKKTTGTLGKYDILQYCYFATYEKDGETISVFVNNMAESKAASLQQGLSTNEADSLNAKILDAVKDFEFADGDEDSEGNVITPATYYNTSTTGKTAKEGDFISITYTVEETVEGELKSVTYTNQIVELKSDDGFLAKFKDQVAGSEVTVDGAIDGKSYSSVKLDWIINSGFESPISFKYTITSEKEKEVTYTGTTTIPKDTELTYYIFPVYYMDTPAEEELTWDDIVYDLIGENINASMFDCFWNEENKTEGGRSLRELINGDGEKFASLATLITNVTTGTGDALTEAQNKLEERKALIKAVVDDKGLADTIKSEYKQYLNEELEDAYINDIKNKLATEINEYIKNNIVLNESGKLPKKLVNEIFDNLMLNRKNTFYTGTSSEDGTISNYKQYGGSFKSYLAATISAEQDSSSNPLSYKEAKDQVYQDAVALVTDMVKLYAVAAKFDAVVSDKDFKNDVKYGSRAYYDLYEPTYGEIGIKTAYQFRQLFDKIFITEGEQEAIDAYKAAVEAEDKDARYTFRIPYTEADSAGKKWINFKNITYKFS